MPSTRRFTVLRVRCLDNGRLLQNDCLMTMPSINLRELRNTRQLKVWLSEGKTVELRERSRVLGRIVPHRPVPERPENWPDFEARTRALFGDRILPGASLLVEERLRSSY